MSMDRPEARKPAEHTFLTVDGVRLEAVHYQANTIGRPTLVLLHQGLGCVAMWKDFLQRLALQSGYPVFAYSRREYGRSLSCKAPFPKDYMHSEGLNVLPKVIEAAKIDDYILIGHSDGGSIALIHAGGNPGRGLKAVITMAAHVFCEALTIASIAKTKALYESGKLRSGLAKYHYENSDCVFYAWSNAWLNPEFADWNIEEYLPKIWVPQLVMQGQNDEYGSLAQVQSIEKKSSGNVTVAILENCAHSPHQEHPQKTLTHILSFLNQLNSCKVG